MSDGGKWGKIAIGVRIGKFVDPAFFLSFLHLRESGLRPGDGMLEPVCGAAQHLAANILMSRFLKTNLDTLWLIDDDMVFGPDILEAMRTEPQGLDYELIQAVCASRRYPHSAVAWRESDNAPVPKTNTGVMSMPRCGFGCTFIRRNVIELMQMEAPEKLLACFPDDGRGEDIYFSEKAVALGFKVGLCLSASVGHSFNIAAWCDLPNDRVVFKTGDDALIVKEYVE